MISAFVTSIFKLYAKSTMVEYWACNTKINGSNPTTGTRRKKNVKKVKINLENSSLSIKPQKNRKISALVSIKYKLRTNSKAMEDNSQS
jgi:hypothetical protein